MWNVIGKIFGGGDVISKGFDLIDDMHTSDEEMIAAKAKAKIDIMKSYEPFKVAQRYIALLFTAVFVFIMMNGVLGSLYGLIDMANVEAAKQFANSMWLGEIMITIVGFYFGGGLANSIRTKGK